MVLPIAIVNIVLSFYGLYRAYRKKHMIIFIWLILAYYSITSYVSLSTPKNLLYPEYVRMTYVVNVLFCIVGFLLSDFLFNKTEMKPIDLTLLNDHRLKKFYLVIEITFWISLFATYLELTVQDYTTYNTGTGAGWFQVIFQCTSCIILRFVYKKQWLKIGIASVLVMAIVAAVGVRSLFYFILMPIALYVLYDTVFHNYSFNKLIKIILSMILLVWIASYIVNMLRFSESKLPETELTSISLSVIYNGIVGNQYLMSAFHYIIGLLTPIINALNKIGLGIPDANTYLLPSVPKLNAMVTYQVSNVSLLENAAHMPGTIYHDLWYCWGDFASLAAFVLYWYLLKISALFQKNALIFFCFAGVFGWHFYMLLRGAVDTCSGGVAYSILLCFIMYLYASKKKHVLWKKSK